ncbi:MAG: 2-oxoacid:acceptor oxidoreductase subunit alpha [Peptococcaceae bacterium]|nr:2-oxoacid:acceptor oxidoreductase subunit alpha [Peptococcaceae bacterium]
MSPAEVRFLQGNEAFALGGIAAGARFFAGYPISPATEIAEICSLELPRCGGIYIQMEDEIAGIAAAIGASLGGMKAFTATSGPGFTLMLENLGFAVMAEVPLVVIDVQRFGPGTGLATSPAQGDVMTTRWGVNGDHSIIALAPGSVQECYDLSVEAFNLAERFRTPVIVLADATLAHLRERVRIGVPGEMNIIHRRKPTGPVRNYRPYAPAENGVPILSDFGDKFILRVTGLVHDENGYSSADPRVAQNLVRRLQAKINQYRDELPRPVFYRQDNEEVLVVSFGISSRAAREAVAQANKENLSARLLQLRTLWPFPCEEVIEACKKAKAVLVAEMNAGQIRHEVKACGVPAEKVAGVNRSDTTVITPTQILRAIREAATNA